jgi:hypothetical protein
MATNPFHQLVPMEHSASAKTDSKKYGLPFSPIGHDGRKVAEINKDSWDKAFAYHFTLYKAEEDGRTLKDGANPPEIKALMGGGTSVKLNILPQSISISTPFAADVTATNGGVIEEISGSVFRMITISGTTGVFPERADFDGSKTAGPLTQLSKLLPGTATAIGNLLESAQRVATSVTGRADSIADPVFDPNNKQNRLEFTGQYQFWQLYNFFVTYLENKKHKSFKNIRMVFEANKHNIGYVCTPMSFDMGQDAAEPTLLRYKITLKAWDMVALTGRNEPELLTSFPSPTNQAAIKAVLDVMRTSRNLLVEKKNLLISVNADITDVLSVFSKAFLNLKLAANVKEDLNDFVAPLKANSSALFSGGTSDALIGTLNKESDSGNAEARSILGSTINFSGKDSGAIVATAESASKKTAAGGESVTSTSAAGSASPVAQSLLAALTYVLDNPAIAGNIELSSLTIPPSVQEAIDTQRVEARKITSNDIRTLADNLQRVSDDLAYATDSMDADYIATYGLTEDVQVNRELTEDDIIIQAALQESKSNLLSTLATGELFLEKDPDPFTIANAFMDQDDQMRSAMSAYPVRMERDATLERMAQKYLGDANRGREIAILNGLRAPYIDETGFTRALGSVADRSAIVSDTTNLIVGQQVTINGTGVATINRTIANIEELSLGVFRLTFDKEATLSVFTAATDPFISARTPGCVGSGDTILIPSETIVESPADRPNRLNEMLSYAERLFKIDLLLDESGDLVLDASGDFALATGYTNAVQALQTMMEVEQGELEQHPEFGIPAAIGARTSDVPSEKLQEIIRNQVVSDPRFSDALTQLVPMPNGIRITIEARGVDGSSLLPVSYQIGQTA